MIPQSQLTQPDVSLGDRIKATPPGMAFWVATGPQGRTCRECAYWHRLSRPRVAFAGDLKPSRCTEYVRQTKTGNPETVPVLLLPHDTPACRYFSPAEKPLPVERPQKVPKA